MQPLLYDEVPIYVEQFFDFTFWQMVLSKVFSGIVVSILLFWLGRRVVVHKREDTGKGWEMVVILSWLLFISGFFLMGHSSQTFNDPYVGAGLFIVPFAYFVVRPIGKIGVWWTR